MWMTLGKQGGYLKKYLQNNVYVVYVESCSLQYF